jgi:hypothetical protein
MSAYANKELNEMIYIFNNGHWITSFLEVGIFEFSGLPHFAAKLHSSDWGGCYYPEKLQRNTKIKRLIAELCAWRRRQLNKHQSVTCCRRNCFSVV